MSPLSGPYFDGSTLDSPRQHYGQASTANYQQQRDNEQQLLLLSLGTHPLFIHIRFIHLVSLLDSKSKSSISIVGPRDGSATDASDDRRILSGQG